MVSYIILMISNLFGFIDFKTFTNIICCVSLITTLILGIFCIVIVVRIYRITTQWSCLSLPHHIYLMVYTDWLSSFPQIWSYNPFREMLSLLITSATSLLATFITSLHYPIHFIPFGSDCYEGQQTVDYSTISLFIISSLNLIKPFSNII